jgi:hypothetical protein
MIDRALIDSLNLKSRDFSSKWVNQIKKTPQLLHYNEMSDEALIETGQQIYPLLARTLDRGLDKSMVGGFFVNLGKEKMRGGYPISEIIYAISLVQKVVFDFIMNDFAPDNQIRMYQSMGAFTKVADFFLLGSFYITKGFLEETYTSMNARDKISEELLKKYFKDDFFFKQE